MSIEVKVPRLPNPLPTPRWCPGTRPPATRSSATRIWRTWRPTRWCSKSRRRSGACSANCGSRAGATVTSGQLLAMLEPAAEGEAPRPHRRPRRRRARGHGAHGCRHQSVVPRPAAPLAGAPARPGPLPAGPWPRRGIDAAAIQGTGRDGRILKADVAASAAPAQPPAAGAGRRPLRRRQWWRPAGAPNAAWR